MEIVIGFRGKFVRWAMWTYEPVSDEFCVAYFRFKWNKFQRGWGMYFDAKPLKNVSCVTFSTWHNESHERISFVNPVHRQKVA